MEQMKRSYTRRMESAVEKLEDEFNIVYGIEDFEQKIKELKKIGSKSDRGSKLAELFRMFRTNGIFYEKGKDNAYYEKIVMEAKPALPDFSQIEEKMLLALYHIYKEYPAPEDYMKRIVDRLSSEEDGWENDTLRVRILKQFIKYGDYLTEADVDGRPAVLGYVSKKLGKRKVTAEEVLSNIEDDIFDRLNMKAEGPVAEALNDEEAKALRRKEKEKRKTRKKQLELLKMADDLAAGKFRVEGATKKALYLFAMVYGMTYYSGDPSTGEIYDYYTDIEKNLFRDYYTNNLMRFIRQDYKDSRNEYEADPSGQGINYKNFAEMVYLYYIAKPDPEYSPQEKVRLSQEMIKRLQEGPFKERSADTNRDTQFYKNCFYGTGADSGEFRNCLQLPSARFEEFLLENFNCDTNVCSEDGGKKIGPLQLETGQNSAYREYQAVLRELKERNIEPKDCNYGLWFADVAAFRRKDLSDLCDSNAEKGIDRQEFERFKELLLAANDFIGYTVEEKGASQSLNRERKETSVRKIKAMQVSSPQEVTRTSLIVAYYYLFNAYNREDEANDNFRETFENFRCYVDGPLERSGYQPLNGRNLFDLLIVFSAYADMKG